MIVRLVSWLDGHGSCAGMERGSRGFELGGQLHDFFRVASRAASALSMRISPESFW